MLRNSVPWFLAAFVALANPAHAAVTTDAPHNPASGFTCSACHSIHPVLGGTGYNNICLNCHRPGFPRGGGKPFTDADMANPFGTLTSTRNGVIFQTSHAWQGSDTVAKAGAQPPVQGLLTTNSLRNRTSGQLACVRCHNQHSNQYGSFLRAPNDQDQLCLDCHRSRNTTDHKNGTHPVGINYTAATAGNPAFKGISASSGLKLIGGKVLCSSCHGVHYSDSRTGTQKGSSAYLNLSTGDGNILKTALRGKPSKGPNLCTACHAGKVSHNKRSQDVQCGDCHGGHVNLGDGTTPNVWLVNRQMRFSSALRSAKNKPVLFQSTVVKNYKDANGNGVCQSCHDIPLSAGFQTYHAAADTTGCNNCHTHANPVGSFSVDPSSACNVCHGYPPRAGTVGGPDGYANGFQNQPLFINESTSGHATHASSPYQKACTECHTNNSHATGTFQDVFIPPTTGLVAATGGLTPTYTAASFTCATVYCHSNGAPRTGTTPNAPISAVIPSWNNGKGVITGQANAARCNFCHAAPIATNSHTKHINAAGYAIACAVCHSATVSGPAFAATTISSPNNHANGVKDVAFGGSANGGSWTVVTATCTNVYCHSNANPGGSGFVYKSPTWGSAALNCGSCHRNLFTNTTSTGSHKTHAQAPYTYSCAVCHAGYTNATVVTATHTDNSINLSFTAPSNNGGTTPSYYGGNIKTPGTGYQQCLNVYCHSTIQNATTGAASGITYKSPIWGNAASVGACGGCHVNMATDTAGTGNHAKHARIYSMACSTCHFGAGKDPNTGVASPLHADGTIEIAFSGAIATGTAYTQGNNAPGSGYGNCTTSYCHSNGNGTFQTPTWGTTLDCGGCHNKAGDVTWSAPHLKHVTTYAANSNFTCNACHANTASSNTTISTPANHANAVKNVSFNAFAGGSYSGGICNIVYCHSNGQISTPAYATITWAPTTLSCGDCHGTSNSGTLSSKHIPHTNNAAVIGTNFTCADCHAKTVAVGNGTITDYSKHVNKLADYSGIRAGGSSSYNSTTKVCTNSYCHSSGKRGIVAVSTEPANPAWNTGTLDCKGCHGARITPTAGVAFNSIAGEPNYTNAGSAKPGANSHQKHVSAATDCISCHYNTVNAAGTAIATPAGQKHIDRTIDVIWNLSNPSTTQFDYTPQTKTCSNIVCHGTLTPRSSSPAQWGDSGCRVCHIASAPDPVFMNINWNTLKGTKPGKIVYTTWSTTGHGRPASADNYPVSGNPPAKMVGPRGCEYCHDPSVPHQSASGSNPMRLRNITDPAWGLNGVCQTCHAKGGSTITIGTLPAVAVQTRISSYHFGQLHIFASDKGGRWCWDCHNPHGDPGNIFMIGSEVAKNSNSLTPGNPISLATATFTAATIGTDYANTAGTSASTKICQTCHDSTNNYTASSSNGHNIGFRCTICHRHNGPTKIDAFLNNNGHAAPYFFHNTDAAATQPGFTGCITSGCHIMGSGASIYPAASGAPDCRGCHKLTNPTGSTATCTSCHGNPPSGAASPNTAGSHSGHASLTGSPDSCAICHSGAGKGSGIKHGPSKGTPSSVNIVFSAAQAGPAIWNAGTKTCSTSFCHGTASPAWGTNTTQATCTKCHGVNGTTVAAYTADPKTAAPGYNGTGRDIGGATAATDLQVGAHDTHLRGLSNYSNTIACTECHSNVNPSSVSFTGHMDGAGSVNYGTLATRNSAIPGYTSPNCTNTYCHFGKSIGGYAPATANASVSWINTSYLTGTPSLAGDCGKCHASPPSTTGSHAGVNTINQCNGCHSHVNTNGTFNDKTLHINGIVEASSGSCITCHATTKIRTFGRPGATLAAVTTEFGLAWGHKKLGRGTVTDADCIVCHLEGDFATQKISSYHANGNIDLRDPDVQGETPITNISGGAFTFQRFSTSYAAGTRTATGHTSNTDIANVISLKFCLKCHDSGGATNTTARTAGGTNAMPFGGIALGATYIAANNAIGTQGTIDVATQMATTNASAHPVLGPRNRAYPTTGRFNPPYNNFTRAAGTKSNGVVLNCFDCHNTPTPLTRRTITAHGNAVTMRGDIWTNPASLCTVCHIPNVAGTTNGNHGAGSAFASGTNSSMQSYINARCEYCHSSSTASPARPIRAQDVHGFDLFASTAPAGDTMWPKGATNTYKPYAFMRNTVNWGGTTSWRPASAPGLTTGTATCGGAALNSSGCTGENMTTYTPGGVY